MTKIKAHALLNKIRSGEARFVSLAETNSALEQTGDICGLFSKPLRANGNESSDYRPRQTHEQSSEIGFSYSRYLDCQTAQGVTQ
jgi:hypothetical protein